MLQSEADAKLVDFGVPGLVRGEQVQVDFGTRGENEPTVLGTNREVYADAVEFSTFGFHLL